MPARVRRPKKNAVVAEVAPRYLASRVLLDTHVWLWWQINDARLGRGARALIKRADEVYLSAASAWEIAIKASIGKLDLPRSFDIDQELDRDGFMAVPVAIAHAEAVRRLAAHHRDPFDRLLIAQAQVEGLTVITADSTFARYDISTVDARL
jgi:PIN domain nuclease of toxin-antitoxin system